jgi:hypothetical protein
MRKMSQKSRANISAGMKASWAKRKAKNFLKNEEKRQFPYEIKFLINKQMEENFNDFLRSQALSNAIKDQFDVYQPELPKSLTFGGRIRAAWRMLTNGK